MMGIREQILARQLLKKPVIDNVSGNPTTEFSIEDLMREATPIVSKSSILPKANGKILAPQTTKSTNPTMSKNLSNPGDAQKGYEYEILPDPLGNRYSGEKINLSQATTSPKQSTAPAPREYTDADYEKMTPMDAPAMEKPSVGQIAAAKMDVQNEPDPVVKADKKAKLQNLLRGLLVAGADISSTYSRNPKSATGVDINQNYRDNEEMTLLRDPDSRPSQVIRGKFFRMNPSLVNHPTLKNASGSELLKLGLDKPITSFEDQMDLAGRNKYSAGEDRRDELALLGAQKKYLDETEGQRKILNAMNSLEELGKNYIKPDFYLENYGGENIPGWTILGGQFGWGKEADDFKAQESQIQAALSFAEGGKTLTDNEREAIQKTIALTKTNDEKARMRAYARLKEQLIKAMQDREAIYNSDLSFGNPIKDFSSKGGRTSSYYGMPSKQTPPNATTSMPTTPKPTKTTTYDPKSAAKTKKIGDRWKGDNGKTYYIAKNGDIIEE